MSKRILVILAHDDTTNSRVNKRFALELKNVDNVEIRNIKALYPNFNIDIKS